MQAVRSVLAFVQLVIGELVIIIFIGHWNLIIGYFSFSRLLPSVSMSVAVDLFWTDVTHNRNLFARLIS